MRGLPESSFCIENRDRRPLKETVGDEEGELDLCSDLENTVHNFEFSISRFECNKPML